MDELRNVIRGVSERLRDREVVTEEEIRRITLRVMLEQFGSERVDDISNILSLVVESLCNEPVSIESLHYSERLSIEGVIFRHLHTCTPTKEKLSHAYQEWLKSKKFLDSVDVMKEVTDRFFSKYRVDDGLIRIYRKNRYRYGVFYSIIDDVSQDLPIHERIAKNFNGEYVVVVPTEERLESFIKFFRLNSERVKKAGLKIWVVNVEGRTIDPFIGYPKDFTLLKGFKNPKIASQINSLWRSSIEEID